jgi:hypothetical protein
MQSHYIYQDTNIYITEIWLQKHSTKLSNQGPKLAHRNSSRRNQPGRQFSRGFRRSNHHTYLTNMPSSTKEYLVRTATLLQNRANDIRQQPLQQQAITEKITLETRRTKRGEMCWIYRNW